jgi:uncharacterized protein YjbJ (UPF0337 family)
MRDLDDKILEEKYNKLEEGLWDRMKARGAGAIGSAKGLGNRFTGAAKAGAGTFTGNKDLQAAGQQQAQVGKSYGIDAKAGSLMKSHIAKIQKAVADFQNDVSKLGLENSNPNMSKSVSDSIANMQMAVEQLQKDIS